MKLRNVFYVNPEGDTLFKDVVTYGEIPVTGTEVIWSGIEDLVSHRVENFDDSTVTITLTPWQ